MPVLDLEENRVYLLIENLCYNLGANSPQPNLSMKHLPTKDYPFLLSIYYLFSMNYLVDEPQLESWFFAMLRY